jgi:hypothetical protein
MDLGSKQKMWHDISARQIAGLPENCCPARYRCSVYSRLA